MTNYAAVVLAAGLGKRMKSDLPKVLHPVAGKPMVGYVVDALKSSRCEKIVVVIGHKGDMIKDYLGSDVEYAIQEEQLGTGHAVMQAESVLQDYKGTTVVLYGDNPAVTDDTILDLIREHQTKKRVATVVTADLEDPFGYGRVIRMPDGGFDSIVEEKDATKQQRGITEVNSGIYAFDNGSLFESLKDIGNDNAQREYLLPDVLRVFRDKGMFVGCYKLKDPTEMTAVNSRKQQAQTDRLLRDRVRDRLMEDGVTLIDPDNIYIDSEVEIGRDSVIYPFTFIQGRTKIGERCVVGAGCKIVDSTLGSDVRMDNSIVLNSVIGSSVNIGPFAYIRPDSTIADNAKIGDFTEIKKSSIGKGSKVPHLSYVGDSIIGQNVNIGAGTITCNYDGKNKFQTIIGDDVFVGSNSNLIAPVTVKDKAYIAAGSTINKDVPAESLAIGRARQVVKDDWVKKHKTNE